MYGAKTKGERSLLNRAVNLLSRREHSEKELRDKLRPYAQDQEELDQLIEKLHQGHWQSDERFAENFVNSRQMRWGNRKILHTLKSHALDAELLQDIRDNLQETEFERAKMVWENKFHGEKPNTPQEKAKQIRFLANRGFSARVVYKIISSKD